jgi:hypothetical protein
MKTTNIEIFHIGRANRLLSMMQTAAGEPVQRFFKAAKVQEEINRLEASLGAKAQAIRKEFYESLPQSRRKSFEDKSASASKYVDSFRAATPAPVKPAGPAPYEPKTFGEAVSKIADSNPEFSTAESVRQAVDMFPELHAEYRKTGGSFELTTNSCDPKAFAHLVAGQVKLGKSMADAVTFCVKMHTRAYEAWRQSGDTTTLTPK